MSPSISNIYNKKTAYILIYGLVSIMGLLKSYIFLDYFDLGDLGLINLCQTFIISISLLQLGIITGGFRLFSYKKEQIQSRINSVILTFFIILYCVLNFLLITSLLFIDLETWFWYLIFLNIGILSLYANWVNNQLIALRSIGILNILNLSSAVISISVIFLAPYLGVFAAILTFFLQSFTLILLAYILVPTIRPSFRARKSLALVKALISVGFTSYFTGAITYFNSQFSRWLIFIKLGLTLLGKTSLAGLFSTVSNVIPNAISNLYFPEMVATYENEDFNRFELIIKRYFLAMIIYVISLITSTILLGEILVSIFFPKHLDAFPLVYASLPAIGFTFLCNPVLQILNVMKKFRNIFIGSLISVISFLALVLIDYFFFEIALIDFFVIESTSLFFFFVYNYYLLITSISHDYKEWVSQKNVSSKRE